jgi:hypothetical protein
MVRQPGEVCEPPSGGGAAERRRQHLKARFPDGVDPTEFGEPATEEGVSAEVADVSSEDEFESSEGENGTKA